MSRIDDLIQELCPAGVRYEYLGELTFPVTNIKWRELTNETFKYIDLTSVSRNNPQPASSVISASNAPSRAQQIVKFGDVLFGTTRPMLRRLVQIRMDHDGQICSTGYCVIRANEAKVLARFVFHLLDSLNFRNYVERNQQGASYPSISDIAVRNFKIPLPPLEVQREIVSILDKFDALVNDISIGLPAEIAARRKQYEYYRDKLLTFKELKSA